VVRTSALTPCAVGLWFRSTTRLTPRLSDISTSRRMKAKHFGRIQRNKSQPRRHWIENIAVYSGDMTSTTTTLPSPKSPRLCFGTPSSSMSYSSLPRNSLWKFLTPMVGFTRRRTVVEGGVLAAVYRVFCRALGWRESALVQARRKYVCRILRIFLL